MIVQCRQGDGSLRVFGYMMSDGPLSAASGRIVKGWHHKCFWVARKREARGDQVSGRVAPGTPTGYSIDELVLTRDDLVALGITAEQARGQSTVHLSESLARLRQLAQRLGKGVGDATVQEAFQAAERGGPYPHVHHHRLDAYQLLAHLQYAHGVAEVGHIPAQDQHVELHARMAQEGVHARREADGEPEPRTTDWRTQYVADIDSERSVSGL